jgi:protocatechuate 4,5-dioxygenase alpha chain
MSHVASPREPGVSPADSRADGRCSIPHTPPEIPGTVIFDGAQAVKGYALNKMCYSLNRAENRTEFARDEHGYCRRYGVSDAQREAIRRRDVLALVEDGGNVYYLAKLAGVFGLGVQDIGAQQTGVSVAEFRAKLAAAAHG